jgi:hypothetical protein
MGDTSEAALETVLQRNGLVSGARPRSRPLPRRASDPGTWKREPRKGAMNSGAREGTDDSASVDSPRTSRVLDHLGDVGVRFGGSEPHRDTGHGPPAPSSLRCRCEPASAWDVGWRFTPPSPTAVGRAMACFGRSYSTGPDAPDNFGCLERCPAGTPDACFGRRRPPHGLHGPASAGTDDLHETHGPASAGTDGSSNPPPASASEGFAPRLPMCASARTALRREGTRRPLLDQQTIHLGEWRGGQREEPPPASVSGGFAPASVDARGTLEDSDGFGRRPR